ncbi:MAG: cytochrome c [Rhodocyclaceae bacterium]|nr:cytochrome c [Rhodocyclaceae bacterium]
MDRTLVVHVLVLLALTGLGVATARAAEPEGERRAELVRMVRQDCGSCHGMTLKGGLGPALLPEALAGKPTDSLVATVMDGRPGTPMPGWSRFVSEAEAAWIVERLLSGFPAVQVGGGS